MEDKFSIADAYASQEEVAASEGQATETAPVTFEGDKVDKMVQMKADGDFEGLGKYVSQYI